MRREEIVAVLQKLERKSGTLLNIGGVKSYLIRKRRFPFNEGNVKTMLEKCTDYEEIHYSSQIIC